MTHRRRGAPAACGGRVVAWAAVATLAAGPAVIVGCVTPENTAPVPGGDVNHYDAVAGYGGVAAYAGPKAELIEMEIIHARSDGTVDLEAKYEPRVEYEMFRPDAKSEGDEEEELPVGARGKSNGFQTVHVTIFEPRIWSVTVNGVRHDERHLGMDRNIHAKGSAPSDHEKLAIPPPTCSLRGLWKEAIEAGAPKDAVADIHYDREGWTFKISDIDFELKRTGADCTGKGKAPSEAGGVPTPGATEPPVPAPPLEVDPAKTVPLVVPHAPIEPTPVPRPATARAKPVPKRPAPK
ncbi:MAG TPA: hypothetical protein VG389_15090 [Myxococcota bacterium]|jgi:hypothetical protein|nr:hypothetical protein [Myxococcota bacterium]